MAPLLFCGLLFAAAGSANASPLLWAAGLLLVTCGALCQPRRYSAWRPTPIAIAVWAYVGWVVIGTLAGSAYTAAGIFHPAFLAVGFAVARSLQSRAREQALGALLAGMVLLALWALWQSASGEGRAYAQFETPNTLATVLNLVLAPLLVRIACGDDGRRVFALAVLLTAALVATLSRGGLVALTGGLSAVFLFYTRPRASGAARMLKAAGLGAILGVSALQLPVWLAFRPIAPEGQLESVAATLGATLAARMELYRLALSALGEHPWLGTGYLGFNALLEAGRAQVPSYAVDNITYFVHDDYLQTLVELGLPGFVMLVAIVVLPFCLARRLSPSVKDRLSLHAALAGIAAMAIHALADFPFYVPICLLLFGALLGEVDRLVARSEPARRPMLSGRSRLVHITGAAVLALIVLPPPIAEATAAFGERSWRSGHGESAAFAFELARRFQARDWRYHWYAAQFWYAQAMLTGRREHADLADHAFAAAMHANPSDPRPLLGRLATQLRFAGVLGERQSPQTLRGWAERALALAPLNASVQKDYAAALAQLGSDR